MKGRSKSKQKDKNCYLCSKPLTDETSILDHVWPRSAGGGNGKSNLRVAHESCEGIKEIFQFLRDRTIHKGHYIAVVYLFILQLSLFLPCLGVQHLWQQ